MSLGGIFDASIDPLLPQSKNSVIRKNNDTEDEDGFPGGPNYSDDERSEHLKWSSSDGNNREHPRSMERSSNGHDALVPVLDSVSPIRPANNGGNDLSNQTSRTKSIAELDFELQDSNNTVAQTTTWSN
jgi:hypothetical protein